MADYFCQFSCVLNVGSFESAEQADAIRGELAAELDRREGAVLGFEMEIDPKSGLAPSGSTPTSTAFRNTWRASCSGAPKHSTSRAPAAPAGASLVPHTEASGGGRVLDLAKRRTVASIDCADWLADYKAATSELAEHRQREVT